MPVNSVTLFLSAVTCEFDAVREDVRQVLSMPGVRCETQKSFLAFGSRTLVELNNYVRDCDTVVHLVGRETGDRPKPAELEELGQLHPDLLQRLRLPDGTLQRLSYTQWEAWLALYHRIPLLIAPLKGSVPAAPAGRHPVAAADAGGVTTGSGILSQREHLSLLAATGRFPDEKLVFERSEQLCIALLRSLQLRLPAVQQPIANLPPSIGSLFKGRDESLADLRNLLRSGRQAGAVGTAMVAIYGTGGFGKTQLATEYAHLFAHEHSALLFLSAPTAEQLEDNLADLAGALHLHAATSQNREQQIRAVLDWLANPAFAQWLLIIDNVDTLEAMRAVLSRLQQLHHGHVLLTTRLRNWPQYVKPLELQVLSTEAAAQYLLERTEGERIPLPGGAAADQAAAEALVRELGGMALAVNQAAATIHRRAMSIDDYLQEWQHNRDELLNDELFDELRTGYPRTMAASCQTSLQQLDPLPRFVFDALCLLGHAAIPERLLRGPWSPEVTCALPAELQGLLPRRTTDVLLPLYEYCLADKPHGADRLLGVHNVIQDATRRWQQDLPEAEQLLRRRFAEALVQADFVRPDTTANETLNILPQLRQTEPHAAELMQSPLACSLFRAGCRRVAGQICWTVGQNTQAVNHLRQAAAAARAAHLQGLPGSALELARTLNEWIFVQNQAGNRENLLELCEEARQLTADWHSVSDSEYRRACATCCQAIGRVYESCGNLQQALPLLERACEICIGLVKWQPENLAHKRDLGIAYNNLGRIRESQGNFESAAELFERSRVIIAELLDQEPLNLAHKRDLGIAYSEIGQIRESQGNFEAAAELFEKDRVIIAELLDQEPLNLAHKRSLGIAYNNLGRIRQSQGNFESAAELFEKDRVISAELLDQEPLNLAHKRDLGIAYDNLGRIRESQGNFESAAELFEKHRSIFAWLLDQEPLNLAHKRSLGIAYDNIGRALQGLDNSEAALDAFEESSRIDRDLLARNPGKAAFLQDFAVGLHRLGPLYLELGYSKRAESVLREAVSALQQLLGAGDRSHAAWARQTLKDVRERLQRLEDHES